MVYTRLRYIEDDEHEVLWVRLRPLKLPRKYSCIVIACIYHPPKADNGSMREYMITSLYSMLRCYQECGIILTGDFNQMRDSFLRVHYWYAQLVNMATRNGAILDKIWSNMSPVYAHPAVLSELGSSDHRIVLLVPSSYPTFDTGMIQTRVIRRMGATERMAFASARCRVRWEYRYAMDSCEERFQFFQETMTELIDTCFPLKTVTRHSSDKPWATDRFRHLIRQATRSNVGWPCRRT